MSESDIQQTIGAEFSVWRPEEAWHDRAKRAREQIARAEALGALLDVEWCEPDDSYGCVCTITARDPLSRLLAFGW